MSEMTENAYSEVWDMRKHNLIVGFVVRPLVDIEPKMGQKHSISKKSFEVTLAHPEPPMLKDV